MLTDNATTRARTGGIIGIGKASKPLQFQRSWLIIFLPNSSILEFSRYHTCQGCEFADFPRIFSE